MEYQTCVAECNVQDNTIASTLSLMNPTNWTTVQDVQDSIEKFDTCLKECSCGMSPSFEPTTKKSLSIVLL